MSRMKLWTVVTLLLGCMMALPFAAKAQDHMMARGRVMTHHRKHMKMHHKHHKGVMNHSMHMKHQ